MNISKSDFRNHNGIQYFRIKLVNLTDDENNQLQYWMDILDEHQSIIEEFHNEIDSLINMIMDGKRGEVWQYHFDSDNMVHYGPLNLSSKKYKVSQNPYVKCPKFETLIIEYVLHCTGLIH